MRPVVGEVVDPERSTMRAERAVAPADRAEMIDAGLLTREDADDFQRLYLDPNFYYPFYTLFAAWGRKPVQRGGTLVGE